MVHNSFKRSVLFFIFAYNKKIFINRHGVNNINYS